MTDSYFTVNGDYLEGPFKYSYDGWSMVGNFKGGSVEAKQIEKICSTDPHNIDLKDLTGEIEIWQVGNPASIFSFDLDGQLDGLSREWHWNPPFFDLTPDQQKNLRLEDFSNELFSYTDCWYRHGKLMSKEDYQREASTLIENTLTEFKLYRVLIEMIFDYYFR